MDNEAKDLLSIFDDLERQTSKPSKDTIIRAPFGYPGGKSRSVYQILPKLPYRRCYVEPFGGSAAILLARQPSPLEVYNDRYAGVVAFYRCLRDAKKLEQLIDWLEHTVHSREDFVWCKETWKNVRDDVERAGRWYYMSMYSFGSLGRNWGRTTSGRGSMAGKIRNKLKLFPTIHKRFRNVQVENQDFRAILRDYDSPETVFYLDPPYLDANRGTYKNEMSRADHQELMEIIFKLEGFVALSGYANPFYENHPWSETYSWDSYVSIQSLGGDGNQKDNLRHVEERGSAEEVLFIKEAK